MAVAASYPVLDLAEAERQVLASVRKLQADNGGRGYGEVRVTVKEGRIVTIRREHIEQMRGDYAK